MADCVVVGSGQTALNLAGMLAGSGASVTLVERLPAVGGQEPERPHVDTLAWRARSAGVEILLDRMAVAWDGSVLSTLGGGGAQQLPASVIALATGTRPATRGELGIAGDRAAGVVPGSAAVHLTQSGVLLGRRPLVVGSGQLARHYVEVALAAGADEVTMVHGGDWLPDVNGPGLRQIAGCVVDSVWGMPRVSAADIRRDGHTFRVATDAVILATGRIPVVNVEGAEQDDPRVVQCHHGDDDPEDALTRARSAAGRIRDFLEGPPPEPNTSERRN